MILWLPYFKNPWYSPWFNHKTQSQNHSNCQPDFNMGCSPHGPAPTPCDRGSSSKHLTLPWRVIFLIITIFSLFPESPSYLLFFNSSLFFCHSLGVYSVRTVCPLRENGEPLPWDSEHFLHGSVCPGVWAGWTRPLLYWPVSLGVWRWVSVYGEKEVREMQQETGQLLVPVHRFKALTLRTVAMAADEQW